MEETVAATDLLTALVQLAPQHAATIIACARETALQDMHAFCAAIRRELPGTLLFDAVLRLRGSQLSRADSPGAAAELVEHAVHCRASNCSRTDCVTLRGMLSVLKQHSSACHLPKATACRTCQQWRTVRSHMRKVAKPDASRRTLQEPSGNDSGASLLMHLARTALQDLPPSSPRLSPSNSPSTSPRSSPLRKRPKPSGDAARTIVASAYHSVPAS